MPAKCFFMLVVCGPQGTVGRVATPKPFHQGGSVWSHGTHDSAGALSRREAGSEATGHMAAPEPTSTEKRDSEL
jgi:hypothetical protein